MNEVAFDYKAGMDSHPAKFFTAIKSVADPHRDDLEKFLHTNDEWATQILREHRISVDIAHIQQHIDQLEDGSELWFAANSLLQTHTLRTALARNDICTAILLGLQLSEFRWQADGAQQREQEALDQKLVEEILKESGDDIDQNLEIAGFNAAIDALHKTYPHCNLNALRLLLANKMNVSKQRLDDLDIRPTGMK